MNVIDGLIAWSLLLLGAVAAVCKWWCLMCVVALLDGCTDALVIDPTQTESSFTGITVTNALAKSKLEVSVDLNDAGEHYPLVYVLVCQKLP